MRYASHGAWSRSPSRRRRPAASCRGSRLPGAAGGRAGRSRRRPSPRRSGAGTPTPARAPSSCAPSRRPARRGGATCSATTPTWSSWPSPTWRRARRHGPRRSDARVTRWGGGLPQYAVGHLGRVARVRERPWPPMPGLAVCGAVVRRRRHPGLHRSGEPCRGRRRWRLRADGSGRRGSNALADRRRRDLLTPPRSRPAAKDPNRERAGPQRGHPLHDVVGLHGGATAARRPGRPWPTEVDRPVRPARRQGRRRPRHLRRRRACGPTPT